VASEKPGGLPVPYGAESIDAFREVLQGRRSIRTGFLRDKPVPDKLIEKILEAARWAPSAGNSQPWEFPYRIRREITFGQESVLKPLVSPTGQVIVKGIVPLQACDDRKCFVPEDVPLVWRFKYEGLDRQWVPSEFRHKPN
jgi:hypothetical protein